MSQCFTSPNYFKLMWNKSPKRENRLRLRPHQRLPRRQTRCKREALDEIPPDIRESCVSDTWECFTWSTPGMIQTRNSRTLQFLPFEQQIGLICPNFECSVKASWTKKTAPSSWPSGKTPGQTTRNWVIISCKPSSNTLHFGIYYILPDMFTFIFGYTDLLHYLK